MTRISTKQTTLTAAVATAALFALSTTVSAQSSTTRGFLLGAHLGGGSVSIEGSDRSSGGGGGVTFGLGLNRNFTLFAQFDGSSINVETEGDVEGTWTMAHADFGARFHFANSLRSWVPYVLGAFTARAVSISDVGGVDGADGSISGGAFTFGGGVMIYPSQAFAIDAGLSVTNGQFTTLTVGGLSQTGFDVDASSTRFNVGIAWWP